MNTEQNAKTTPGVDRLLTLFKDHNSLSRSCDDGFDAGAAPASRLVFVSSTLLTLVVCLSGVGHCVRVLTVVASALAAFSMLFHLGCFLGMKGLVYARLMEIKSVIEAGTPTDEFADSLIDRQAQELYDYARRRNVEAYIILVVSVAFFIAAIIALAADPYLVGPECPYSRL